MRMKTRRSLENIKSTTLIGFTLVVSVERLGRNNYNNKRRSIDLLFYLLYLVYEI